MSDVIDVENDLAQAETEASVRAARESADQGPVFTGHCLNCGAPTQPPWRWCDVECRDEWQELQ